MNTMDEQELKDVVILANEMGWNGVSNAKILSVFLRNEFQRLKEVEDAYNRNYSGSVDKPPVYFSRDLDVPDAQQSVLTAQDILFIVRHLGLKYRVSTVTSSDSLIVEGQGMLTAKQALDWLRKDIPRYATEEVSGVTYRIALETLIKQLGVKT